MLQTPLAVTVSLIGNVSFGGGCVEITGLWHAIHAHNSAVLQDHKESCGAKCSLKREMYFLMSQAALNSLQFKPMLGHFVCILNKP